MAKKIKTTPNDVSGAILQLFNDYMGIVDENVDNAAKKAARDCVKELKQTSPKSSGEYASNWKSKKTMDKKSHKQYTVYNAKYYRLTHLLEYGHAIEVHGVSTGKRTRAIAHIRPAEEHAEKEFLTLVKKGVKA